MNEYFQRNRKISQIQTKLESIDLILEEAKDTVKEITPEQLREVSSYQNPPSQVLTCMEGVFLLIKGRVLLWKDIKIEMNSPKFISKVLGLKMGQIKQAHVKLLKDNYITPKKWNLEIFQKASKAIGPLSLWVKGVQEFKEETLKAKPYKKQIEELSLYKKQKQ